MNAAKELLKYEFVIHLSHPYSCIIQIHMLSS